MRKIAIAVVAAAAAFSAPAFAQDANGEGRVEARGGIAWANGEEEAVAGVAAGYDFNLGEAAFVGVEASADHLLADGADFVWGVGGRVGANVGERGKLFAAGGYAFGEGEDVPYLGAGYEHKITDGGVYLKAEYRHFFSDFVDVNTAAVGVGFKF
uniref:outer membrane protein n=1 Tax=Parerythrobacter lutipelagi TaxID=1964208 RepID=UPI0010F46515|nr:outer membrane beta-barrel protein [Parerythrobacter lutipelagi]